MAVDNTLIFHIGDPKTGTSSIQRALKLRLATHSEREYVAWRGHNAMEVANCLKQDLHPAREPLFREIADWVATNGAQHSIISSEYFASVPPRRLKETLDSFLPGASDGARVIAYARPHASRFLAAYIQRIKMGQFFGTQDAFYDVFERSKIHRYAQRFGRWRRNFKDKFILRPFSRDRLRHNDIVDDFFRRVFRDTAYRIDGTVTENITLSWNSLQGIQLFQQQMALQDAGFHIRGVAGGALANVFLPQHEQSGAKLSLNRGCAEKIYKLVHEDAVQADRAFFRIPFLVPALEESLGGDLAVSDPAPLPDFLKLEIEALSKELVTLVLNNQQVWMLHSQYGRGLIELDDEGKASLAASQNVIGQIDRKFSELAELSCTPI